MAHDIRWYVMGRVLYVRLWGTILVEEGQQVSDQSSQMLNSGQPLVHIILNSAELEKIPTSISQLQKTMQVYQHPSMGWLVEMGSSNPFVKFVSVMLARLYRVRYRRAATLDEAVAFLKTRDATVNWADADEQVLRGAKENIGGGR